MLTDIYMESDMTEVHSVGIGHTLINFKAVQNLQSFPIFPLVPFSSLAAVT